MFLLSKPQTQLLDAGRGDKDKHGFGHPGTDISRALQFDLQEHALPGVQLFDDFAPEGPISVGAVLYVLKEVSRLYPVFKLFRREENNIRGPVFLRFFWGGSSRSGKAPRP